MGNKIELIQKLYAKTQMCKIPIVPKEGVEQIEFEITPLSLDDLGVLNMKEDMPLSEVSKNTKVMFAKSLGITEEEAAKISFEYMEDLMSAIMKVNNFKEADIKKVGIKDFVKQKQEQIKAQKENGESDKSA